MSSLATRFTNASALMSVHQPLPVEDIRRVAPSIFAVGAHESRSDRYTYIPTIELLEGLQRNGFAVFGVAQARTRKDGHREFTKHMVRLRREQALRPNDGDAVTDVILVNSHNGASSCQVLAGAFRFVCHNGLILGEEAEDIRVPHRGDVVGRVIEGTCEVISRDRERLEHIDAMRRLRLGRDEQQVFAEAALALRWESEQAPVQPEQLLRPRRQEDTDHSLWTTFNVAQENLIRGELHGRSPVNPRKRVTTRPVNGIDRGIGLNRALWLLAQKMRELKSS